METNCLKMGWIIASKITSKLLKLTDIAKMIKNILSTSLNIQNISTKKGIIKQKVKHIKILQHLTSPFKIGVGN